LLAIAGDDSDDRKNAVETALRIFSTDPKRVRTQESLVPEATLYRIDLTKPGTKTFVLDIPLAGHYALVTQHLPTEFALSLWHDGKLVSPTAQDTFAAAHSHDDTVTSVGIHTDEPIDRAKLETWMSQLLREKGTDIFRMKGIINIAEEDERFVMQGVHMLLDTQADRPWAEQKRASDLVFIGRNLNRAELTEGFLQCRS
jgi:G3E family GTPase